MVLHVPYANDVRRAILAEGLPFLHGEKRKNTYMMLVHKEARREIVLPDPEIVNRINEVITKHKLRNCRVVHRSYKSKSMFNFADPYFSVYFICVILDEGT